MSHHHPVWHVVETMETAVMTPVEVESAEPDKFGNYYRVTRAGLVLKRSATAGKTGRFRWFRIFDVPVASIGHVATLLQAVGFDG